MFKSTILTPCALRFRRLTGKGWAAFCSMHREVTIGRVRDYVANLEMQKAGRAIALCAAAFVGGIMYADEPPQGEDATLNEWEQLHLSEVQVVAQRAQVESAGMRLIHTIEADAIKQLPVQTVADLLRYVPGVDIRTRGANGGQADVSMRGGTFDQVLVMINGVNLTDAHTGHYSLNLPIDLSLIERIEVLQGTSAAIFGLNAFAGAINIVTRQASLVDEDAPLQHEVNIRMTAGLNDLLSSAVSARLKKHDWYVNTSVDYSSASGYTAPDASEKEQTAMRNSDYRLANVYVQAGGKGLDVQVGAQYKDIGAGMFYGFGSQDQFDATRTAFASATYLHQWGAWSLEAQAMYRANYDRYEWHRGQRLYGNFHFTQNAAANLKAHYSSRIGRTTAGIELRNENIRSTNLGDTINPNGQVPNVKDFPLSDVRVLDLRMGKNRLNINYFAEQSFIWHNLSASLGVSGNWNTLYGHNLSGGANIGYRYAKDSRVYVNANRSLRLPTFTDLYYNAGNQLGNRNLRPEEAWVLSVGTQYVRDMHRYGRLLLSADWYYRWGRNIIDWVYTPSDSKRPYHAQNWQQVDATGVEAVVDYALNAWLRDVKVSYAYTYLDLDVNQSGSRYLDYLSHHLTLGLQHALWVGRRQHVGATWTFSYQKREGQYNDADGLVQNYRPVCLLDASLYWQSEMVKVALECTNLTNRHYYDYGGILQPGAWPRLNVTIHL